MSVTDSRRVREGLRSRWFVFLPALASIVLSVAAAIPHLSRRPPSITPDSALYLYVGRRMTRGALPYLTTWDVKPPAIFETTALISVLVGGDPFSMHVVGLAANAVALALSCVFLTLIARRLTANSLAALAAGFVPLAYPYTYLYAARGIRAIFFLCLFGLAAIYCYLDDRPIVSTASGALAAAYWHFGLLFPLAVCGAYWYRALRSPMHDRTSEYNHWLALGTLAAVTLLVCAPFVLGGALGPLLIQTVVVHLIAPERIVILGPLRVYLSLFALPVILGGYGAGLVVWRVRHRLFSAISIRSTRFGTGTGTDAGVASETTGPRAVNGSRAAAEAVPRGLWWVPLTIGWFLFQVLALDMDGPPDFVPLTVFAGLGVACLIDDLSADRAPHDSPDRPDRLTVGTRFARRHGTHLLGLVLVAVGISVIWVLLSDPPFLPTTGRVPQLFFSERVGTCHVRFTEAERLWLSRTAANPGDKICLGSDLGTVLDLLRAHR